MIRSFKNKGLQAFADSGDTRRLSIPAHAARIRQIVDLLQAARHPRDMDIPGLVFHPLKGQRGRYSVRVTGNWRVTFGFDGPDAIGVDLEDYH